jgi:hypothetical protein
VESKANQFLTTLFVLLCTVNFGYLLVGFLSIPGYYERVTTLTIQLYDVPGANYPTNESVKQAATEHGLTLSKFAIEQIVFHSGVVLLFLPGGIGLPGIALSFWFLLPGSPFMTRPMSRTSCRCGFMRRALYSGR